MRKAAFGPLSGLLSLLFFGLVLSSLVGCGSTDMAPRPIPPRSVPEAEFLIHPLEGYPWSIDPAAQDRILTLWRAMTVGPAPVQAVDDVRRLLAADPHLQPARLVLAEERLVQQEARSAIDLLESVVAATPDYTAAQIVLARAYEKSGRLIEAYEAYGSVSAQSSLSRRRAEGLEQAANEQLIQVFDDALQRGRFPDAEEALARMEAWNGRTLEWLEARRRWAVAQGDEATELEALREIVDQTVASTEDWIRLAELEIGSGDLRAGIDLAEDLQAERPEDGRLRRMLLRGRLVWRLQTAPNAVREVADRRILTRAEIAALLYWLYPEIRYAPAGEPPIAGDILEHPFREEILRIMDLGLITVDRVLHRFEPDVAATRSDVLAALLRWYEQREPPATCLAAAGNLLRSPGTSTVCSLASSCRLLESPADCLPEAPVSGTEAVELFALGLESSSQAR